MGACIKPMAEGKKDRIAGYLTPLNRDMLFGELSSDFLHIMGAGEILSGVPVPISEGENGQIAVKSIVLDMAKVIGADPDFVYPLLLIRLTRNQRRTRAAVPEGPDGSAP